MITKRFGSNTAIVMKTNTLLMSYEIHLFVQMVTDGTISQKAQVFYNSEEALTPVTNESGLKMRRLLSFAQNLSKIDSN